MTKLGRHTGMKNQIYHETPGLSKSRLDLLARAPEAYIASLETPREETKAMRTGSALHKLVLEPDTFGSEFAVTPEINRRTKEGKADYESFKTANADKTILDPEEMETASAMAASIRGRKVFKAIMAPGEAETSFFWNDAGLGTLCKCRPDYLRDDSYIIDLKTTEDASPEGFSRSAEKYRYHVQAAYYMQGVEAVTGERPRDFIFLVVEKSPPYLVACYFADAEMIRAGNEEVRRLLTLYEECVRSGVWPGYPDEVLPLSRPRWAS